MARFTGWAVVAGLLMMGGAARGAPEPDGAVMAHVRADRWAEAGVAARGYADPVVARMVLYFRLMAPGAATTAEISAFMQASPDWPLQASLARRRDEAMAGDAVERMAADVDDGDGKTVTILFSGDLGPDEKVFYLSPDAPSGFDYILSESTYGGRERQDYTLDQRREALRTEINGALGRGGNLVIPAFAVERSQELLHDIGLLIKQNEISPALVFLDSPLASKVTAVYKKYAAMFDDVELNADELFNDPRFRIVEAVDESKAINQIKGGASILAGNRAPG